MPFIFIFITVFVVTHISSSSSSSIKNIKIHNIIFFFIKNIPDVLIRINLLI